MEQMTKLLFTLIGTEYIFLVEHFSAEEKISEPFSIVINLVSKDKLQFKDAINSEALLTITYKDGNRHIHGLINNFMLTGNVGHFYTYQATVIPALWMLNFNSNFRIFQNASVVEIVTEILDENQIASGGCQGSCRLS